MIAVFTGTRQNTDEGTAAVRAKLYSLQVQHHDELSVLVGDCPTGIDAHVRLYCKERGIDYATFNANWEYHKKRAGPRRNTFMVQIAVNLKIAGAPVRVFYYAPPGVKCAGTRNCVREAVAADLTCYSLADSVELT